MILVAGVQDHAACEMAISSKLGIDGTMKLPGEGFKRSWPSWEAKAIKAKAPLIKMDEAVKAKVEKLFKL